VLRLLDPRHHKYDDPSRFGVWIHTGRTGAVVHLTGELDLAVGVEIQTALDCAVKRGARTIVIDLSRVTFIDAYGIGLIVRARRSAIEQGVRFGVSGLEGQVAYTFALAGLGDLLVTAVDAGDPGGDVDGR
jgi:anti-sigma B factor antagonist